MRHLIAKPGSAIIMLLASAITPPIAADEGQAPLMLEPASAWQASYENERCRLTRVFTANSGIHALMFEQRVPGAKFDTALAGPALTGIAASGKVRVDFGPDGVSAEHAVVKDANEKLGTLVFVRDVGITAEGQSDPTQPTSVGMAESANAIDTAAAKPLRQITIAQGGQTLVFATGALAGPFSVLNDCTSHILETWGLDADAHRTAQRRTEMQDEQRVARGINGYYPPRAAQERRQGVVGVAILVDETGAATDCKITHDSGHVDLNSVSCKQMMKARFDPALDADGQPMKSYWVTRITFRLG